VSFESRNLTVEFQLFDGTSFDSSGDNTYTAAGLRVSATVERIGIGGLNSAQITVWGLPPAIMNQLSTLGKPLLAGRNNLVTLTATSGGGTPSTVYIGTILTAYVDGVGQPSVGLVITSCATLLVATRPLSPSSFPSSVDVATLIQNLATQAGVGFLNFGVTAQINSPYLHGSAWDQAKQIAEATQTALVFQNNQFVIWPLNSGNSPSLIPLISPDTGLVSYPAFTDVGLVLTTLFNPQIQFGGYVKVQSSIQRACGTWQVFNTRHDLESQMLSNGKWFTYLECHVLGQPTPIAG
jgi:hypothetical protein